MTRRVVCAASVTGAEALFAALGEVVVVPDRDLDAAVLAPGGAGAGAEVLVVRSRTRVDRTLLEGSEVRFVATATAGVDHLDVPWLEREGVAWAAAPGSNAVAVAEHVVASLLWLATRDGTGLEGGTLAVVGAGHVGTALAARARALGMRVLENDPPLAGATGDPRYRPLDEVLAEADVVSLHVPLTEGGAHPTRRLADPDFFERLRPGCTFVNTARGEVVDAAALGAALEAGTVARAVIDVWEGEPSPDPALVERVHVATAHLAGHSLDARLAGTRAAFDAACRFLGEAPGSGSGSGSAAAGSGSAAPRTDEVVALALPPSVARGFSGPPRDRILSALLGQVCDVEAQDRAMRALAREPDPGRRAALFQEARSGVPERRGLGAFRVVLPGHAPRVARVLEGLGFRVG